MTILADWLPVISLVVLIVLTIYTLRKPTNGAAQAAQAAKMIGEAWKNLFDEKMKEADTQRDLARARGEQLERAGIRPVSEAQIVTLADTAKWIEEKFSLEEIDGLALSIGIKPDQLDGDTSGERSRALVLAADRRSRLQRLIRKAREERPD